MVTVEEIYIFAMLQIHSPNDKQGHQPQSGRNGVIDNKKSTTDVRISFCCISLVAQENKNNFHQL